jgi:hypothetical protein
VDLHHVDGLGPRELGWISERCMPRTARLGTHKTKTSAASSSSAPGRKMQFTSTTRCRMGSSAGMPLLGYIADSHTEMPGLVVSDTTTPKVLNGRLLVRWALTQRDEQKQSGTDLVEFGEDGRIVCVTDFYDE